MKPERRSLRLLAITRSKAKMYEYGLPESDHIALVDDPGTLMKLAVGILGDVAAEIASSGSSRACGAELSQFLRFSARYFDALGDSRLQQAIDKHLLLLASSAYYLCDLPGSAKVLASRVRGESLDLDAGGLDHLVWWLLNGDFGVSHDTPSGGYRSLILEVSESFRDFYLPPGTAASPESIRTHLARLRHVAYGSGSPREVLFSDIACAIIIKRIESSARTCLPLYSGLPADVWQSFLNQRSFVQELWPAQRLLGESGVFAGKSAVVQMPTSAGKSRATEIAIRSAFMADRASLAVVVAPFRALCHEIAEGLAWAFRSDGVGVRELSDVFQEDFASGVVTVSREIMVVTPEKLVYVLRHSPDMGHRMGLLVFDEGHQFDAGTRGVTYELLLTSLKQMIPPNAQKILISAVISNGPEIGRWLNGEGGAFVAGQRMSPTERSVAFASWQARLGRLRFVVPENPDHDEFYVPRVIQPVPLSLRGRERVERFLPSKDDGRSVALYLGLKLAPGGPVAIFCGRKDTANWLCEAVVDAFDRGLGMVKPADVSDVSEVQRIGWLYECNLGPRAPGTRAAKLGVFSHHGNTPHGVRLAVEHALKRGSGRFVICTSTLAQGVNLPIRYLLVTTSRQGGERIKVRDFHNLVGRAGRAGMHTEGSVLFANPEIYDNRDANKAVWGEYRQLLSEADLEPCVSTLLSLLSPLNSDGAAVALDFDILEMVRCYAADQLGNANWIEAFARKLTRKWFTVDGLCRQLKVRRAILAAVESFLLAHWDDEAEQGEPGAEAVVSLAERTLAHHLASEPQRKQLLQVFRLLTANIAMLVQDPNQRRLFGRTLLGLGETLALSEWVAENLDTMVSCNDEEALLGSIWQRVASGIRNETFKRWQPAQSLEVFAQQWISGKSFYLINKAMLGYDVRIGLQSNPRKLKIEHVVELGENALGFDGAHIVGAIADLCMSLISDKSTAPVPLLSRLQKRLKYGLPSVSAITIYEAGFADRVLATELAGLAADAQTPTSMIGAFQRQRSAAEAILKKYPDYYFQVFLRLLT